MFVLGSESSPPRSGCRVGVVGLAHRTIIEVFPTQAAFAVRITGKPWIHRVGACTGRVIALASPRESAQLTGAYNLAAVLKHEFTHTVTLAATENRIPHWFTEGLAFWQENSDRSFFWCTLLAEAVRRGELPSGVTSSHCFPISSMASPSCGCVPLSALAPTVGWPHPSRLESSYH